MIFTVKRPDGSIEHRRHVPFNILQDGARWKAVHAGSGQLLGRFDSQELAERSLSSTTEIVPHFKPRT
jgi:hypothetical protein